MPTIRERVRAGEPTVGVWLGYGSPLVAEDCAKAGFDWAVIDTEHGMGTEADVLGQLFALRASGAAAIVRVERSDRLRIGRMLDLGADGLVVPRLDTTDEVRDAISWMRFPPAGVRGVALGVRGQGVGHDEVGELGERPLGVFQIESGVAVQNAPEMAAIDGVDVLFVGPADLSHSLGVPGRFDDPRFDEALRAVGEAAAGSGKQAGILLKAPSDVPRYRDLGYRFIGIGSDYGHLRAATGAAATESRRLLTG
jgi:2-keto-3-deoxy-L-rhamnonate aldolase RhmA